MDSSFKFHKKTGRGIDMVHVLKREFTDSFKSVRSILIILFFTFVSYQSAKFFRDHQALLNEVAKGNAITAV